MTTLLERYLAKFIQGAENECWLWTAHCDKDGYGKFYVNDYCDVAHRYGYKQFVGPIPPPPRNIVRHTCDNPPCQNPSHWLIGTSLENAQDKMERGRYQAQDGEHNGHARLTRVEVTEIRERFEAGAGSYVELGVEYGVSRTQIRRIVNGQQWQEVQ